MTAQRCDRCCETFRDCSVASATEALREMDAAYAGPLNWARSRVEPSAMSKAVADRAGEVVEQADQGEAERAATEDRDAANGLLPAHPVDPHGSRVQRGDEDHRE